jgi:hypothetical protein
MWSAQKTDACFSASLFTAIGLLNFRRAASNAFGGKLGQQGIYGLGGVSGCDGVKCLEARTDRFGKRRAVRVWRNIAPFGKIPIPFGAVAPPPIAIIRSLHRRNLSGRSAKLANRCRCTLNSVEPAISSAASSTWKSALRSTQACKRLWAPPQFHASNCRASRHWARGDSGSRALGRSAS